MACLQGPCPSGKEGEKVICPKGKSTCPRRLNGQTIMLYISHPCATSFLFSFVASFLVFNVLELISLNCFFTQIALDKKEIQSQFRLEWYFLAGQKQITTSQSMCIQDDLYRDRSFVVLILVREWPLLSGCNMTSFCYLAGQVQIKIIFCLFMNTTLNRLGFGMLTAENWSCLCFFTDGPDGKQHKARELDMITRDLDCPWHDYYIICSYDTGADFENSLYAFGQSKES